MMAIVFWEFFTKKLKEYVSQYYRLITAYMYEKKTTKLILNTKVTSDHSSSRVSMPVIK